MRSRTSYFWTLLLRSLVERRSRVLVSLLTVALGTSVIGAFVLLNADLEAKMSRELRAYGANFVLKPSDEGQFLDDDALKALNEVIPAAQLVGLQPCLYDIVTVKKDRLAAAGIDFGRIEKTPPYWQLVEGELPLADAASACVLGKDAREAAEALEAVGMGERIHHKPSQLSGGEQQRVCIARALINHPSILLADEPTGNLDRENEEIVLELIRRCHDQGRTIVPVTHNPDIASLGDTVKILSYGRLNDGRSELRLEAAAAGT